ncbi:MAG: tetratricopeptide repeat protein, partial [Steroidobacteraceae bacterium]
MQRATEIVQIEKSRDAGTDEMSVAYHRLGKAQLLVGNASAASESLQRALQLLEVTESIASPRFIEPLADLAEAQASLGAHDAAIALLQQAIVISRRVHGLFNTGQLDLLDRMASSFEAIGDIEGIDRARRYAVLAAEQEFGPNSPDILPAIGRLANWFELTGRYAMAQDLYERTVRIASLEGGERNSTAINALLGVGRSHRLQYVETPELVEDSVWGGPPGRQFDPVTGNRKAIAGAVDRPGLDAT